MKLKFYTESLLIIFLLIANHTQAQWEQTLGPGSGTSTALYAKSDTLFTGNFEHYSITNTDPNAGTLYRSTDHAQLWFRDSTGFNGIPTDFTHNGSTVFVSTLTDGIFRSLDNGSSWSQLPGTNALSPQKLLTVNGVIYVGGLSQLVSKSTDNGNSFVPSNAGLPTLNTPSVSIMGNVGSILFIQLISLNTADVGIYRSIDNGASWQLIRNGFATSFTTNGNRLFAVLDETVYFSDDLGITWTLSNNGLPTFPSNEESILAIGDTLYTTALINTGTFLGWIIYKSSDNGNSWSPTGPGIPTSEHPYDLVHIGNEVYTGSGFYGSVYRTINGGQSWEPANIGLPNADVRAIYPSGNLLFSGSFSNAGVHVSSDGGHVWLPSGNGLPDEYRTVNAIIKNPDYLFAGMFQRGVYRSNDNGANWQPANTGLSVFALYINCFTTAGTVVFAGTENGVYRSTDNGNQWTLASPVAGSGQPQITTMASLGNFIYAGTPVNGLFRSADNGATWQNVNNGLNGSPIYSIIARGNDLILGANGIFTSTDNGNTWIPKSNGLQLGAPRSIVAKQDTLFAALYDAGNLAPIGISRSNDNGNSWFNFDGGIKPFAVRTLAISVNTVFAGTETESIWNAGISSQVLPVHLLSFNANAVNNKYINLTWKVAQESSIQNYTIERAAAGSNVFSPIGTVAASNSILEKLYEFNDGNAARNTLYQYRLKISDLSLGVSYSEIKLAKLTGNSVDMEVMPNPGDGHLKIFVNGFAGDARFTIINATGQQIYRQKKMVNNAEAVLIDISAQPHGLYFLKAEFNSEIITVKIILE